VVYIFTNNFTKQVRFHDNRRVTHVEHFGLHNIGFEHTSVSNANVTDPKQQAAVIYLLSHKKRMAGQTKLKLHFSFVALSRIYFTDVRNKFLAMT
jgi:hypothetical protein